MTQFSGYQERPVAMAGLARWVPCVWVRRMPAEPAPPVLVVPDGCVDLMWIDGELAVAGPDTRPREVPLPPGSTIAGVRLGPGAARLLLGDVPASALVDTQVRLAELWGTGAEPLATSVRAARPWAAADLLAEAVAARRAYFPADPLVREAVAALDRPRPPALADLAAELGVSERQLRRRTTAAVGYGPKTLAQVLRFGRLRATATRSTDWARLAAETGYADQAHLSRQVRRWSGHTPTELVTG